MQFFLPTRKGYLINLVQLAKLNAVKRIRDGLKQIFTILFCSGLSFSGLAEEFFLSNIVQTDQVYSKNIFVVEKGRHLLHLFTNENNQLKKLYSVPIASGKIPGDKEYQGDKKTPEGIYFLGGFYKSDQLIKMYGDYGKIYGIGAFTSDYPNPIDKMDGKTGDGIWLHSTNDVSRIEKGLDSRGCVVVNDENLKKLSDYIEIDIGTPYIVTQELKYWNKETYEKNKSELQSFFNSWVTAWRGQNINDYLSHYDEKRFKTTRGARFPSFKARKKRVFKATEYAKIDMDHVSILHFEDYVVVRMKQSYESNLMNDSGFKTLYLRKNKNYQWKIVWEQFNKLPAERELAFSKSGKRYFE